jgi:two-component system, chemotaxis family, CheB/CheR fusion protein
MPIDMVSGSLGPLKIVVVDDDPQIRDFVGRCLVMFGASVTLCENGFKGIRAVEHVRPDVALVDLIMPDRDGLDLLRRMRKLGPKRGGDVPAIVTTGLRDPELETAIREAGFTYLAKPFTPIELFNSITQALERLSPPGQRFAAFPSLAGSRTGSRT